MSSVDFHDDPHIERIARALWTRNASGSAAVLVGAGFSRNATPIRSSGHTMPGWNDIYATMVEQLYPVASGPLETQANEERGDSSSRSSHRDWLLGQAGATSAYLRLAEEFEAQFGRDVLDKLILQNVPDRQFAPGQLHHMLLQLPWADVMTTNWDTLLERAAETTEERAYQVVRTVEEIPEARSPRIIKLHGSFPAHRPFVFTEEDFRTYPIRAGAFVNLSQQLAMENTLVLLGFSGDDPNFLFWSGWVRDRLGPNAPLIYLVGALDLSAPRRKMLESRRIQPIDLSKLPQFEIWPEQCRTARANQWFLERLRAAEPYPLHRWPRPAAGAVPPLELANPRTDPRAPLPDASATGGPPPVETLRRFVEQWRQNRCVYPGWIVPPLETIELLSKRIERKIPAILRGLRALEDDDERLEALFELNWQQEAALVPLALTIDDVVAGTLEAIEPRYDELSFARAAQFRSLALAFVRHAREEREIELFHRWADWLQDRIADHPELSDRLAYERILWTRSELDVDALDRLVASWEVQGDSIWLLRKAGVLADLGRDVEAAAMSAEALAAIRSQTMRGDTDIGAWSRESFALLFRSAVLFGDFGRWSENKPVTDRFDLRQDQLQARGCPGKRDFFAIIERLGQAPPALQRALEIVQTFDLGATSVTHNLSQVDPRRSRLLAYQALRFQEEAGLPLRVGNTNLAVQLITEGARWLMDVAPTRAIDALLRTSSATSIKQFDLLLTRATVARTPTDRADVLVASLMRTVEAARQRVAAGGPEAGFWQDRLKAALEIASRFVIIAPQRAPQLLALGLSLQADDRLTRIVGMATVLRHVVGRTIEGAGAGDRDAMLLAVMRTPIPQEPKADEMRVQDVAASLPRAYQVNKSAPEWRAVVSRTIRGVAEWNERLAASGRLHWLLDVDAIDSKDQRKAADALWAPGFVENGLPSGTVFYPASFLALPRPHGCDPTEAVRSLVTRDEPLTDEIVSEGALSHALANSSLVIEGADLTAQIKRLDFYVRGHDPEPAFPNLPGEERLQLVEHASLIGASLARRALGDPLQHSKIKALFKLSRHPLRTEPALPSLIPMGAVKEVDAVDMLRKLLASDCRMDAVVLQVVLDEVASRQLGDDDALETLLWREIGWTLAGCRSASVTTLLRFCADMAGRDQHRLPASLDANLGACLRSILQDTEQTSPAENLRYDSYLARRFASLLVKALSRHDRLDEELRRAWSEAVEQDPLPDARLRG